MNEQSVTEHDRRRKRALIIFQVLIYGFLVTMFIVQTVMYSNRDW
jgi:hypothetical protein